MQVFIKIILTIVVFFIVTFLLGILHAYTGNDSVGMPGLIIGAGFIGAIIAIWRYKTKNTHDNNKLNKF